MTLHLWWTEDNDTVTTACGIEGQNFLSGDALDRDGNYMQGSGDPAKVDCVPCLKRARESGIA